MTDLLQEVKEDLLKERYLALWKQYGKWCGVAIIGLILVTGGSAAFRHHRLTQAEAEGKQFYQAMKVLEEGKEEKTLPLLEALVKEDRSHYALLAGFKKAALLKKEGKDAEAAHMYKSLWDNKSAPAELKDLAGLHYAAYLINHPVAGEEKEISMLLDTIAKQGHPWSASGKETKAFWLLSQKKQEEARALFVSLAGDEGVPSHVKERAQQMVESLGMATHG